MRSYREEGDTVITLRRSSLDLDSIRKVAMDSATNYTSLAGCSSLKYSSLCCGYKIKHFDKLITVQRQVFITSIYILNNEGPHFDSHRSALGFGHFVSKKIWYELKYKINI